MSIPWDLMWSSTSLSISTKESLVFLPWTSISPVST